MNMTLNCRDEKIDTKAIALYQLRIAWAEFVFLKIKNVCIWSCHFKHDFQVAYFQVIY